MKNLNRKTIDRWKRKGNRPVSRITEVFESTSIAASTSSLNSLPCATLPDARVPAIDIVHQSGVLSAMGC
jgi:hypothetical protein